MKDQNKTKAQLITELEEMRRRVSELERSEKEPGSADEEWNMFFEHSVDLISVIGYDRNFKRVNPSWYKVLGWSEEELLGMTYLELIHPDDLEATLSTSKEHREDGSPVISFQNRYRCKDGSYRCLSWNATPLPDRQLTFSIARDITEEVRVEERNRLIFEFAPDAYYLNDLKGNFIDGNKAAEKITGYKKEELIGKSFLKLNILPKKLIPKAAAILAKNALGKPTGPDKFTLNSKDGNKIEAEISTHPVEIEGETLVLGIARDITDRIRAEGALRESEEKFRSLFENMQSGFALHEMVFDEAGKPIDYIFLNVNETFEEQTTLKRENIIGRRVTEALPGIENDPADWIGRYGKVVLTGNSISFENYAESLERWYSVVAYKPNEGQFAVIFLDITDKKRAEQELQEAHDTLEERVEDRTRSLKIMVNSMAGREVRMVDLKQVIKKLRNQLIENGMEPVADDPLKENL